MLASKFLLYALAFISLCASAKGVTPAEQKVAAARRTIDNGRGSAQTYNELALALAQRARETADPNFYDQANTALDNSFRLDPNNFEGQKARIWILLGKHEFREALRQVQALNEKIPDDLTCYAMLVDAHIELGNYAEAEASAQTLLDLRPGNVAGLTRGAYLRELFGDLEGALEFMTQAYERTPPYETEERSWLLTHIGHLHRLRGQLALADAVLAQALECFNDYHYALAELARVRWAQRRNEEAVDLFKKRYDLAPHPENLFEWGQALQKAGKRRQAQELFRRFEKAALAESNEADNANRELILYYIDYARKPVEALQLAKREFAPRQDIQTLHLYAWALYANGQVKEAREQIARALTIGSRDPDLLQHARKIGVRVEEHGVEKNARRKARTSEITK